MLIDGVALITDGLVFGGVNVAPTWYTAPDNTDIATMLTVVTAMQTQLNTLNVSDIKRILGLCMENRVEDTITYDSAGRKTGSIIWSYDSAVHAATNDHVTGLVASYQTSFTYNTNGQMTLNWMQRST